MNKSITFFLFLFLTANSFAQENSWTIEQCIALGLENSLEVKIKQIEIKRTQKRHNSIANNLLPTIGFDANQSYNFGSTIDPSTNGRVSSNIQNDNFFLSAKMNLIDFNTIATSQFTKLDIERAKVEKEVLENEYKLQIVESYFTALYTQELLKIQENQLINAKSNLDRIQKEETIGSKPKSDLYDIQLSVALEEKNILETKQLAQIQRTQLFQLLNVNEIENCILMPYLKTESNENNAEFDNPKIKLANLTYELGQKRIKQVRGTNLPTLSAFYNYSTFYYKPLNQPDVMVNSFNDQFSDNKNQQVGLQISVPIFNGFRNSKNVKALQLENEKQKVALNQEDLKLKQQIQIEEEKIKQITILDFKLLEIKELTQKTFKTSQSKFEAGKIDAIVFSTVKNQLLQSEYDVLKNKLQHQFTAIKINLIKYNQL
ncbi:TolC family protein [uncultured Flavobacterium sp.]|uniref:TolC family protein n=1 Tax=uncultured Flavobacterium sp. TaxID=165435 RepID=UPI0030ED1D5E|tara:strand:+ start:191742 stop:193034 length:1293 start_codon:yes stop_codon:yes gene_type:complete